MPAGDDTLGSVDSLLRKVAATPDQPPPPALDEGTLVAGAFRIERRIGAGGMGIVYLARDQRLGRAVALKLHAGSDHGLLAEARVTARLAHPNIVTLYEVGTFDGRVFLAMEYLAAGTLRRWLDERPRRWDEALDRFLEAARGLAAAHDAGLVHRDFKPENVLLGDDGRARVADFGLARIQSSGDDARAAAVAEGTTPAGTPAYMSPEQRRGETVDARSDQYSFCLALRDAVAKARAPRWLRAVVARGLDEDPARRWPSMDAVAERLLAGQRRRRRFVGLGVGAGVALAAAAVTWLASSDPQQACRGAPARLAGVWDGPRRDAIRAALTASIGADTAAAAIGDLDRYAADWATAHREACLATEVRREQSERLLHARMGCLDQARAQLAATVDLVAGAPDERSLRAVAALPSVRACADTAALAGLTPVPDDPALRAEAEAIRAEIGRLAALTATGRDRETLDPYRALVERARKLGYLPLLARALQDMAVVEGHFGLDSARVTSREAFLTAVAGGDDMLAVRSLVGLAFHAFHRRSPDGIDHLLDLADAFLRRHPDEDIELRVMEARALYLRMVGKLDEAEAEMGRVVERQRKRGSNRRLAELLNGLAYVQGAAGHDAAQQATLVESIALIEKVEGPDHPLALYARLQRGAYLARTAAYEDAERELADVLPRWARVYGEEGTHRWGRSVLADVRGARGDVDGAIATLEQIVREEAAAAREARSPALAGILAYLARQYERKGDYETAIVHARRAQSNYETVAHDSPEFRDLAQRIAGYERELRSRRPSVRRSTSPAPPGGR